MYYLMTARSDKTNHATSVDSEVHVYLKVCNWHFKVNCVYYTDQLVTCNANCKTLVLMFPSFRMCEKNLWPQMFLDLHGLDDIHCVVSVA